MVFFGYEGFFGASLHWFFGTFEDEDEDEDEGKSYLWDIWPSGLFWICCT